MLLQENLIGPGYSNYLANFKNMNWLTAVGFYFSGFNGIGAGVSTGAKYKPSSAEYIESEAKEPLAKTPKMTIFSKYKIKGRSQELLVINVHGINFVNPQKFERHIRQIERSLAQHKGPLFLAGDFNTWNLGRHEMLQEMVKRYNLKRVKLENEGRRVRLDHIFTRGIAIKKSLLFRNIESSDHYPLYFLGRFL